MATIKTNIWNLEVGDAEERSDTAFTHAIDNGYLSTFPGSEKYTSMFQYKGYQDGLNIFEKLGTKEIIQVPCALKTQSHGND